MTVHTEEQARQKWCPFARTLGASMGKVDTHLDLISGLVGASVNREPKFDQAGNESVEITARHRCIGSECMAWHDAGEHKDLATKADAEFRRGGTVKPVPHVGFCGLAGAP